MREILMIYLDQFISNIQKYLGKGSDWIIDSVMDVINVSKYNLLAGSSYIKLPKELNHSKKGLIFNILMIMNALNGA